MIYNIAEKIVLNYYPYQYIFVVGWTKCGFSIGSHSVVPLDLNNMISIAI